MEILRSQTIASVEVTDIQVTEDELTVLETALTLALHTLGTDELEQRFGASRDEIEALCNDLHAGLRRGAREIHKPVLA
jgi:uncharacterized small protein (DUF1192 family)